MATTTTPKPSKASKPSKTPKAKGKPVKPTHPGGGKAKSTNEGRVMHPSAPKSIKGSDGRTHSFGRYNLGITKK